MLLLALPAAPAGVVKIERISPRRWTDGHYVALAPDYENIPAIGTGPILGTGVYVWDRATQRMEFLGSDQPTISGDGRHVALRVLPSGRTPGGIVVWDRQTRTTEQLPSCENCGLPVISADGRSVAFGAWANGRQSIRVWDRLTGTTMVARSSANGGTADGDSYAPTIIVHTGAGPDDRVQWGSPGDQPVPGAFLLPSDQLPAR